MTAPARHLAIAQMPMSWEMRETVAAMKRASAMGIAASFGAPTYLGDGSRLNGQIFVRRTGKEAGVVHKIGLTAPEATFFAPGATRPVFEFEGLRCTAVICREIEDREQIVPALAGTDVELVVWPGLMSPEPGSAHQDPPAYVVQAQALARAVSAHVVQANWPQSLNYPHEDPQTGRSACISPSGELLFRLPANGFGVATFRLGDRSYRWHDWHDRS